MTEKAAGIMQKRTTNANKQSKICSREPKSPTYISQGVQRE